MTTPPADLIEFLATVVPFDALPDAARSKLAASMQITYYQRGERVADFQPPGQAGLHIVRKGAVVLIDKDGGTLEQRGEGELFGHRIAFDPPVDGYTVVAEEDSLIWSVPQERVSQLMAEHETIRGFLDERPGIRLARESAPGNAASVRDLIRRGALTTSPDGHIADCARTMAEARISCLPVVEEGRLVGIVTDRDLRNRVLARDLPADRRVIEVMTPDPSTIRATAEPAEALVEMMRLGIHHLPVVDDRDKLIGVVSSGDLMQLQAPDPLRLVRDVGRAEDVADVARLVRQAPAMLAKLAQSGTGVEEIGRMAGRVTDACTARLLEFAEARLGAAPMAWTWLAFGSQARLEQGLVSDQDNGLLLAAEPDEDAAVYFRELAQFVCEGLDACGYVFCPGGVMAQGEWRLSRQGWRNRFDRWMREPDPKSVMHSSIFFDLRPVRGDLGLAEGLRQEVLEQARGSEIFRRFLAGESMSHRPPLGLFRQFVQERGGAQSKGLNLKQRGVIPVVDLARVHALEGALPAVHTAERIAAAADAGLMTAADADDLVHAHRFIGNVRLRHQAAQLADGEKPDHLVDPSELSNLHRRYLRSAFSIVTSAQRAMAQHYML